MNRWPLFVAALFLFSCAAAQTFSAARPPISTTSGPTPPPDDAPQKSPHQQDTKTQQEANNDDEKKACHKHVDSEPSTMKVPLPRSLLPKSTLPKETPNGKTLDISIFDKIARIFNGNQQEATNKNKESGGLDSQKITTQLESINNLLRKIAKKLGAI
jgi:hypothetical protein